MINLSEISDWISVGAMTVMSSAYWNAKIDFLIFLVIPLAGKVLLVAAIICSKVSTVRLNSIGDKGSPWCKPLLCVKYSVVSPLMMTREEVVSKRVRIHLTHLYENPLATIILNRDSHSIKSNALAKSIFLNNSTLFVDEICCHISLFATKFFVIWQPWMNAVCLGEMRLGSMSLSRFARTLEISFGMMSITLIGRNSLTKVDASFFGTIITLALFTSVRSSWLL